MNDLGKPVFNGSDEQLVNALREAARRTSGSYSAVASEAADRLEASGWVKIDRDDDEQVPSGVVMALGWFGFGGKFEVAADFYHSPKGGWYHGSAEYYIPLPAAPTQGSAS